MIDPEEVNEAFLDSLYREEELIHNGPPPDAVIVKGIIANYGFHPVRLAGHGEQVMGWLAQLPNEFQETGGGGWSFLNACDDKDGNQWTGFHQRMEQLFCLGIGLGLAKWQLPRELWDALPGGMPYVVVLKGVPA